jgi:hypothetical protein
MPWDRINSSTDKDYLYKNDTQSVRRVRSVITDPVSKTLCSSVFLEYRTMDKVQKPNSPECHIPSSEPFK